MKSLAIEAESQEGKALASTSALLSIINRPALPPELQKHLEQIKARGAQTLPLADLNTRLPIAPIQMSTGGGHELVIYPGPLMKMVTTTSIPQGTLLGIG